MYTRSKGLEIREGALEALIGGWMQSDRGEFGYEPDPMALRPAVETVDSDWAAWPFLNQQDFDLQTGVAAGTDVVVGARYESQVDVSFEGVDVYRVSFVE